MRRRRTRLRPYGRQAEREREARERFREIVLTKANGRCERCGRRTDELEAHHMRRTSLGGKPEVKHNPAIGAALCGGPGGCHSLVHDHLAPDWMDWFTEERR